MSGVSIGPFQRIVSVNWKKHLPSACIIRMVLPRFAFIRKAGETALFEPNYNLVANLHSEIADDVLGSGSVYPWADRPPGTSPRADDYLYGRRFGLHSPHVEFETGGGSCAIVIALPIVAEAYKAYNKDREDDTGAIEIPFPEYFDIEVAGFCIAHELGGQTTLVDIEVELYTGDKAIIHHSQNGPNYRDFRMTGEKGFASIATQGTLICDPIVPAHFEGPYLFAEGATICTVRIYTAELKLEFLKGPQ